MKTKRLLKKLPVGVISLCMCLSCAGCGVIQLTSVELQDDGNRETAFAQTVQKIVNQYGVLSQEKQEESWKLDDADVSGLLAAETFDITGDGEDELFCAWLNDTEVEMVVYEYQKNQVQPVWNGAAPWAGIFGLQVYRTTDGVYWSYHCMRHFTENMVTYRDGSYIQTADLPGFTEEENAYIYSVSDGLMGEGSRMYEVLQKRLGINDTSQYYGTENHLLSLHAEGKFDDIDTDTMIARWNLTVPEPRLSPLQILSKISYYGAPEKCVMTKQMALAYAEAIEQWTVEIKGKSPVPCSVKALLMDVAGDGMPLLITAAVSGNANNYNSGSLVGIEEGDTYREAFEVWTWNGTTAQKYDFVKDTERGYTFGYDFFPGRSNAMIVVGDGVAQSVGDASGSLKYQVANGQITLKEHTMSYSAYVYEDGKIANGALLPGVKTFERDGFACAYVEDLLAAGWLGIPDEDGKYTSLSADYRNGKMIRYGSYEEYANKDWDAFLGRWKGKSYRVCEITTGDSGILGNWSDGTGVSGNLRNYAKVAGKPSYAYDEVSVLLTDAQIQALADEAAKAFQGELGEIYRISDDLYYVTIYVEDEFLGGVRIKNVENGTTWRTVSSGAEPMTETQLQTANNEDQAVSNISIDYARTEKSEKYLRGVLEDIDGTVPNDAAKGEIITYVETCITGASTTQVKAKKNGVTVTDKTIEKSLKSAIATAEKLDKVLEDKRVTPNKDVTVILNLVCKNIDLGKPVSVVLDSSAAEAIGEAGEVLLNLDETGHGMRIKSDVLRDVLEQYGKLTVTLEKQMENTYAVTFTDADNQTIDRLPGGITFTLPAKDELCTVQADYNGASDNWGGQFDAKNKTISFETPYAGTYTVLEKFVDIKDLDGLSEEHQKAIRFMVSKGYFSLDGDSFHPNNTLTRYDFSEALVRIFFALDRSVATSFTDVPADSPYYPYVASGEQTNIIEGYEDNTFRGELEVLREEVLALCSRTLRERKGYLEPESPEEYLHFTDMEEISHWAHPEIALAVRETLIAEGGYLQPQQAITRADSALMLYRLFMLLYDVEPTGTKGGALADFFCSPVTILLTAAIVLAIITGILVVLLKRRKLS